MLDATVDIKQYFDVVKALFIDISMWHHSFGNKQVQENHSPK